MAIAVEMNVKNAQRTHVIRFITIHYYAQHAKRNVKLSCFKLAKIMQLVVQMQAHSVSNRKGIKTINSKNAIDNQSVNGWTQMCRMLHMNRLQPQCARS